MVRAVAQRCPEPQMHTLISLGGQHQGIYGLPHCMYPQHKWCGYLQKLLSKGAYWSWVQSSFVQAEYWHDPLNEETYRNKSGFLADINNEQVYRPEYKENLMKLKKFVMVKFENDTMVEPVETEWFGFYTPGQDVLITSLEDSEFYKNDLLGLMTMNKSGKLAFLSIPGDHLQFSRAWFTDVIINQYLR